MAKNTINVYIDPTTIISYAILNKTLGKPEYTGKLILVNRLALTFPEGSIITIAKNEYILVKKFYEQKDIPIVESYPRLFTLNATNEVEFENGIQVSLLNKLNIELPYDYKIILKPGTLLQQRDSDICLTLSNEKTVEVHVKRPEEKTETPTAGAKADISVSSCKCEQQN